MSGATIAISERDVRPLEVSGCGATIDPPPPMAATPHQAGSLRLSTGTTTTPTTERNDATSWFADALAKLARMRWLRKNWESSGALPPNDRAISLASVVLWELSDIDLQPSHVDPSTDEGVSISFRRGTRYAELELSNSGEVFALTAEGEAKPIIWQVLPSQISEATARINIFICG